MQARVSIFASAVFVVLSLGAAGCDDNGNGPVQARLNGPSPFQSRLVSVEPAALVPEFLSGTTCRASQPFRMRFNLLMHADRNLFLRRLGFELRDRSGRRVLPIALLTSTTLGTVPGSMPVEVPTAPAIPIPGTLPFFGAPISPPFGKVGLLLNFDCGVPALGTLFIDVETADGDGVADVSHVSVPVGASGS